MNCPPVEMQNELLKKADYVDSLTDALHQFANSPSYWVVIFGDLHLKQSHENCCEDYDNNSSSSVKRYNIRITNAIT